MTRTTDLTVLSDMELVVFTRSGVDEAYAELWRRHSGAIMAAARTFTGFDPEDVMQEAFTRILTQLRDGQGPDTAFLPYALYAARNIASNMSCKRANCEVTGEESETFENAGLIACDDVDRSFENSLTLTAFKSLPTRWQEVLWYRDVEDFSVKACSDVMGIQENATSALLKRAREGFKQAWITANLSPGRVLDAECRWVIERLAKHTRGRAPAGTGARIEAHLSECRRCAIVAEESNDMHRRLALVLLPAIIGASGAAGYRAWVQSGENAIAKATEPSLVTVKRSGTGHVVISAITSTTSAVLAIIVALALAIAFAAAGGSAEPNNVTPDSGESVDTSEVDQEVRDSSEEQSDAGNEIRGREPQHLVSLQPPREAVLPLSDERWKINLDHPAPDDVPGLSPDETPDTSASGGTLVQLSADPEDGVEVGVYPRLIGVGTPGATVNVTVTNENMERVTAEVPVTQLGSWSFTPAGIEGTLTIDATQTLQIGDKTAVTDPVRLGVFEVGFGLMLTIDQSYPDSTTLRVSGFGPESKNQVVTIRSANFGDVVVKRRMDKDGQLFVSVPHHFSELSELTVWQGDTSTGPVRKVWFLE
ncbi:sigma-70 family RNA polymerase sigma factor [Leucobacter sp. cx-169]|uniref:sigma-70 family RNA polymerase sigma factor n=1 Tax=Leucobacter sp. cx-169 TaxID=2770549 RepID=UPI00165E2028|nr:sigma-70 family RNA polymerase sigma factor [Leucobacter sp. cx-169]MBC9927403.1 sigma-70 family RNA polymerase sigma factor [Leucobacter sp. cx-169]